MTIIFKNVFKTANHADPAPAPLPPGQYRVRCVNWINHTSKKGGKSAKVILSVVAGEHKGRQHFEYLALYHKDSDVVQKAADRMAMIFRAFIGEDVETKSTAVCEGKDCIVTIVPQPDNDKYTQVASWHQLPAKAKQETAETPSEPDAEVSDEAVGAVPF